MQKAETQIIFYLLQNKENVGKTIREIASAAGVSVGAVHSTLTDLTNRGFIVDDGKTRLLRKRQSLIDLWTHGYAETMKPKLLISRFTFLSSAVRNQWQSIQLPETMCWGGEPAAALLDGHILPERWDIYTADNADGLIAIKKIASETTFTVLRDLSNAVSMVVRWIINLAPFGIMGIMFTSVSTNGIGIFKTYGTLILVLVGTMLFMALVVVPAIVGLVLRHDPYPLVLKCLKSSAVTAFFTRSSAANIPVNMALCKKLGLDREFYSVSIPLGATVNMSGAAITITIMSLATVHTLGISVTLTSTIIVCLLATIGACGTSGVAGGSLLLIPLACAPFGVSTDIAMQVVAVGFIIGVVQDSMETALNSTTDAIFTATAEYAAWRKQGKPLPKELFRDHKAEEHDA